MDEYAEEKRTEKNNRRKLIVRSGVSEAETTNNKRLRSTFCIEAIQTRSIARPFCDSRLCVTLLRALHKPIVIKLQFLRLFVYEVAKDTAYFDTLVASPESFSAHKHTHDRFWNVNS